MEASLFELEMMRPEEDINDEFSCVEPGTRQTLTLLGTSDKRQALSLLMRYQSAARRSCSAAIEALRELQGDRFNPRPGYATTGAARTEVDRHSVSQPSTPAATYQPKLITTMRRNHEPVILREANPSSRWPLGNPGEVRALAADQPQATASYTWRTALWSPSIKTLD